MLTLGFVLSLIAAEPASAIPVRPAATCPGNVEGDTNIEGDDGAPAVGSALSAATLVSKVGNAYATPAVIDCRLPVVSPALQALVGECAGVTVPDASYRTSRLPESELPAGALAPSRSDAGAKRRLAIVAGVPSQPTNTLAPPSGQPLALFAVPDVPRPLAAPVFTTDEAAPRSALGRRLERPPWG